LIKVYNKVGFISDMHWSADSTLQYMGERKTDFLDRTTFTIKPSLESILIDLIKESNIEILVLLGDIF